MVKVYYSVNGLDSARSVFLKPAIIVLCRMTGERKEQFSWMAVKVFLSATHIKTRGMMVWVCPVFR